MQKKIIYTFFVLLIAYTSCTKDKGSTTGEKKTTTDSCSTNITYAKHIVPIINQKCALSGCHVSTGSSTDFSTWTGTNSGAKKGHMKERVNKSDVANYPAMPQTGSLSACEISKINAWIDAGALNN